MAHILIGLYHSLAEAEGIVHALVEQGFARPCLTLATPHATLPAPEHLGLQTWSTLEGEQGLRRRLLDLGVPDSEVHTYTEAVRQGDTLVVVQASAEQAERGLDILHGPRLADPQTGRPHWQYLGHVGVISHGDPTPHTAPERVDTPGLARAETDFRQHQAATAPESGLTSLEYEPAYRYGYDVGQRFPEQDWGTLEAGLRAAGNGGIQAPGSASKTPSGMAGRPSAATSIPWIIGGGRRPPRRIEEASVLLDPRKGRVGAA